MGITPLGRYVTLRPRVPIQVGGVLIDLLTARDDDGALVHLKLKSPRMKDATDVDGLAARAEAESE